MHRLILRERLERALAGRPALTLPPAKGHRMRLPGTQFHNHPEVFFMLEGTNRIRTPGRTFDLRAGSAALIPQGLPHGEEFIPGRNGFCMLVVMFHPDSFSLHCAHQQRGSPPGPAPIDHFSDPRHVRLLRHVDDMDLARREGISPASPYIRASWIAWLDLAIRCLDSPAGQPGRHAHPLVNRALELVEINLALPSLGTSYLARRIGCSPDHLSRTLRLETGRTLMRHILDQRVNQARLLLERSDLNIAETAWACGFTHPTYFNRIFRQIAGCTPRSYRAAARGATDAGAVSSSRPAR